MTKTRETLKTHTHKHNDNTDSSKATQRGQRAQPTPQSHSSTTEPVSRNKHRPGTKVYDLTKVAKHPPEQPTNHGGKASA